MLSLSPRLSPVSHGRIDTRARAGLERPGRATAAAVVTAARATSPMGKKRRAVASSSRAFEVVEEGVVPPLPPLHEFSSSIADGPAPDPDDAPSKRARVAGPPPKDGTEDGRWNLAAVVRASFPDRFPTIASAKKSVRRGEVRVSGEVRRPDYRPAPGEPIAVVQRTAASAKMNLEDLPANLPRLRVAYEDAHAAIVVKPEGIPTVGNAERGNGWTAERMLPYFLTPTTGVDGALARPRPAHRLDAATGGLLVVAKTRRALASLCLAFENRTPRKRYRALLCGDAGTNAADAVGGDDENGRPRRGRSFVPGDSLYVASRRVRHNASALGTTVRDALAIGGCGSLGAIRRAHSRGHVAEDGSNASASSTRVGGASTSHRRRREVHQGRDQRRVGRFARFVPVGGGVEPSGARDAVARGGWRDSGGWRDPRRGRRRRRERVGGFEGDGDRGGGGDEGGGSGRAVASRADR